jgi:hypothetical protein
MSMLEDFWLPRKEGGRGTEISTLPGGQNLGEIEDILYFKKKLYRSLNVPLQRLEQETQYSLGRATEVSRDEIKFQKFVDRLRLRFSKLFTNILKKQLILKGIITEEDWADFKYDITIDYQKDNHYTELKDIEILRERLQNVDQVSNYIGQFFSKEWVMKNVLKMSEDEITEMEKQMEAEKSEGDIADISAHQQQQPFYQQQMQDGQEEDQEQKESIEHQQTIANIELMETVKEYLKNGK